MWFSDRLDSEVTHMKIMNCNICNKSIPQDSAFCPFCGNKVEPQIVENTCPHCNKSIPQDSEFCPFCGSASEQTNNNQIKTPPSETENSYNTSNQTHYDFTKNNHVQLEATAKELKHIKVSDDEKIILLGDIRRRNISMKCWVTYISYYVACFLLFYFTHTVEHHERFFESGPGDFYYLFLGFIKYRVNDEYNVGAIISIVIICLLSVFIPIIIHLLIGRFILATELLLTDKYIYLYLDNDYCVKEISLSEIRSIDSSPSWFYQGANRIKIKLTNNDVYTVHGLSNATEFIQECIAATQAINLQ